jgi:hypothetical protein
MVAFERPSRSNTAEMTNEGDGAEPRKSKASWVEETVHDISVLYHGVAFLDLTALLYPGGICTILNWLTLLRV